MFCESMHHSYLADHLFGAKRGNVCVERKTVLSLTNILARYFNLVSNGEGPFSKVFKIVETLWMIVSKLVHFKLMFDCFDR